MPIRVRYQGWLVVLTVLSTGCADFAALAPKSPPSVAVAAIGTTATPIQVYGSWHCGNDACTWATVRDTTNFDAINHWLIERGDGRPSVNVVVLSFVHAYRLLKKTTDAQTLNGIPRGMTSAIVNYFKSRNIRVMLSIGGISTCPPGIRRSRRTSRSSGSTRRKSPNRWASESRSTMKRPKPRTLPDCRRSSTRTGRCSNIIQQTGRVSDAHSWRGMRTVRWCALSRVARTTTRAFWPMGI